MSRTRVALVPALLVVPLVAGLVLTHPVTAAQPSRPPLSSGTTYIVKELPGKAAAGFVFSPATLRIHKGQTVLWVDANTTPHNIVGTDRASKILIKRTAITTKAYAVTFTKAGTYKYVCQIHPGMK